MSAPGFIPPIDAVKLVVLTRAGLGFRVGIETATGQPVGDSVAYSMERPAERAAIELADAHDLLVARRDG